MGRTSKRRTAANRPKALAEGGAVPGSRRYKAGIYARLSADADKKNCGKISRDESAEAQIEIAQKFAEEWNRKHADKIEVTDRYIDLGKTGTNFDRDAFRRLMRDVRMGQIDCVIVKDLSRFGRNYLEAGNYIEKVFPFLGVRFIAVADGYDTGAHGSETKQMASEIKNLVNEMYAKDFSLKAKATLAQRRKEGSYVGGPAPYGYRAGWEGRMRKLIPDENTAGIVRYIYEKFVETESYTAVADELNRRRINPPAIYHKTGRVCGPPEADFKGWDKSGVERIIKNAAYSGKLVQGKTGITARDESSRVHKPEKEWVVKEGAHEPLIGEETIERAAGIREKLRKRKKSRGHPAQDCPIGENIFDKVLYCGVCGRKMTRSSYVKSCAYGSKRRIDGYFCLNGSTAKTDGCSSSNRMLKSTLTDLLLSLFKKEFETGLNKEKTYLDTAEEIVRRKKREAERKLRSAVYAKEKLTEEECGRYMDYRLGKLSQKDYAEYKTDKESQVRELAKQELQFKEREATLERNGEIYLKAVRALLKVQHDQALAKELIETMLEKIYVYPGKRVEVLFSYTDALMGGQGER